MLNPFSDLPHVTRSREPLDGWYQSQDGWIDRPHLAHYGQPEYLAYVPVFYLWSYGQTLRFAL